jgi:hypothetical protein
MLAGEAEEPAPPKASMSQAFSAHAERQQEPIPHPRLLRKLRVAGFGMCMAGKKSNRKGALCSSRAIANPGCGAGKANSHSARQAYSKCSMYRLADLNTTSFAPL